MNYKLKKEDGTKTFAKYYGTDRSKAINRKTKNWELMSESLDRGDTKGQATNTEPSEPKFLVIAEGIELKTATEGQANSMMAILAVCYKHVRIKQLGFDEEIKHDENSDV